MSDSPGKSGCCPSIKSTRRNSWKPTRAKCNLLWGKEFPSVQPCTAKSATVAVQSDPERKDRVKQEISTLTGQIKNLRKEVALCEDIAQRSEKMRENLRVQEEKENSSPKREEYRSR